MQTWVLISCNDNKATINAFPRSVQMLIKSEGTSYTDEIGYRMATRDVNNLETSSWNVIMKSQREPGMDCRSDTCYEIMSLLSLSLSISDMDMKGHDLHTKLI